MVVSPDVERTIDKVVKLLAKAETTTEAEAEALVAKATELMVRAEIDEAIIAKAQGRRTDEVIEHHITFKGSYAITQQQLMFSIGDALKLKLLQCNRDNERRGTWVGFRSDVERAEVLLTSLLIQQTRACVTFIKANPPEPWMTAFDKFAYKRSHMMGFAGGVKNLISRHRQETVAKVQADADRDEVDKSTSTSVALVLRSKEEQVQDWYDKRYGKLKAGRATRLAGNGTANSAGYTAGRNADLGSNRLGARKAIGR